MADDYTVQEFTDDTGAADPVTVEREDYDVDRLWESQADYVIFDGVTLSEDDIELFAEVYGDDQELHVGDDAERAALDDEYGIFEMFERAEDNVIVPGAQLFDLALQGMEPVEEVREASFDEAVYAGDTFRLLEDGEEGEESIYTLESDAGGGYEEAGTFRVVHGDDNSDVFRTLIPAGMGFWDRSGDVLMGYADVVLDEGFDGDDELVFTREAVDGKDIPPGRLQQYRNRFEDRDGDALTYTVTNLHR